MNSTFQVTELIRSCLVSLILTPFALSGSLNSLLIATDLIKVEKRSFVLNRPLKQCRNKRPTNKTRIKLTETTLIAPTSIHTNKTEHQNNV